MVHFAALNAPYACFSGKTLGAGNNGGADFTYSASITDRTEAQGTGAFRNGQTTGSAYADFSQGVAVINSYGQGSGAGGYTARGGETVAQIATELCAAEVGAFRFAQCTLPITRFLPLPSPPFKKSLHSPETFLHARRSSDPWNLSASLASWFGLTPEVP
jgi:hypothetical protein